MCFRARVVGRLPRNPVSTGADDPAAEGLGDILKISVDSVVNTGTSKGVENTDIGTVFPGSVEKDTRNQLPAPRSDTWQIASKYQAWLERAFPVVSQIKE